MQDDYVIIETTFKFKDEARHVARQLIMAKLSLYIQIREVECVYPWGTSIESQPQFSLAVKTAHDKIADAENLILSYHTNNLANKRPVYLVRLKA